MYIWVRPLMQGDGGYCGCGAGSSCATLTCFVVVLLGPPRNTINGVFSVSATSEKGVPSTLIQVVMLRHRFHMTPDPDWHQRQVLKSQTDDEHPNAPGRQLSKEHCGGSPLLRARGIIWIRIRGLEDLTWASSAASLSTSSPPLPFASDLCSALGAMISLGISTIWRRNESWVPILRPRGWVPFRRHCGPEQARAAISSATVARYRFLHCFCMSARAERAESWKARAKQASPPEQIWICGEQQT